MEADADHEASALIAKFGIQDPGEEKALRAYISTFNHRRNQTDDEQSSSGGDEEGGKRICLAKGCDSMLPAFPLCSMHHAELVSGRTKALDLRNGYGQATYNKTEHAVVYPPSVPRHLTMRKRGNPKNGRRGGAKKPK